MNIVWNLFDKAAETVVTCRDRPHWDQTGALTFVTARLADSMPATVIRRWQQEQEEWIEAVGLRGVGSDELLKRTDLPKPIRRQFLKMRKRRWHEHLDCLHGACVLRDRSIANVVAESLLKFDGERYDLERFVIMPNHMHLLIQMRHGWDLRKQCESWLRFTGRRINQIRNTSGEFWQSEPFDHIARSEEQFIYLRQYILDNPRKANLKPDEYLLWTHDEGHRQLPDSPIRDACLDPPSSVCFNRKPKCPDSESRATEASTCEPKSR